MKSNAIQRPVSRKEIWGRPYSLTYRTEPQLFQNGTFSVPRPLILSASHWEREPSHDYHYMFGGIIGLHRYIRGEIGMGVVYTLTGGFFGIGWIIDLIEIKAYPPSPSPMQGRLPDLLLNGKQLITHNYTDGLYDPGPIGRGDLYNNER